MTRGVVAARRSCHADVGVSVAAKGDLTNEGFQERPACTVEAHLYARLIEDGILVTTQGQVELVDVLGQILQRYAGFAMVNEFERVLDAAVEVDADLGLLLSRRTPGQTCRQVTKA